PRLNSTSARCGTSRGNRRRHSAGSTTSTNSGSRKTADSLETRARENSATPASSFSHVGLAESDALRQHHKEAIPKRNINSSLIAENHITASWWPSCTAKNAAAQNAAVRILGQAAATKNTSHVLAMCSARLAT